MINQTQSRKFFFLAINFVIQDVEWIWPVVGRKVDAVKLFKGILSNFISRLIHTIFIGDWKHKRYTWIILVIM